MRTAPARNFKAHPQGGKGGRESRCSPGQNPQKTVKKKGNGHRPGHGQKTVHLRFEEMDQKKPPSRLTHAVRDAPANTVTGRIYQSIRESEQDNVGVESAHKSEEAAETAGRLVREGYRPISKALPDAAKAEHRLEKANVDFLYQKSLQENPQLASNPFSRWQQSRPSRNSMPPPDAAGRLPVLPQMRRRQPLPERKKQRSRQRRPGNFFWRHRRGFGIAIAFLLILAMLLNSCPPVPCSFKAPPPPWPPPPILAG